MGPLQLKRLKPNDRIWALLIDTLWKENPGLYFEKYLSEADPLDPKQIWLKNTIAETINFAQAMGQDHVFEGNRSAAIGQGGHTTSFMELLLGAYPTLAVDQDPENWIPTDRLVALGNGLSDEQRSNVFEIKKNGLFRFSQRPAVWVVDHWEPLGGNTTNITNIYPTTIIVQQGGDTYPLPYTPNASTVRVYRNGIRQKTGDFSVINSNVIFVRPTEVGEIVQIFFEVWNADTAASEAPAGDIDGANKEFTLPNTPDLSALEVYLNGVLQNSVQITVSGTTITFADAPYVGDTILCDYKTASASGRAYNISPAGDFDGMNTDFTLPSVPISGTLKVYLNGVRQAPGVQYTLAGAVISFSVAPYAGDWIICDFES